MSDAYYVLGNGPYIIPPPEWSMAVLRRDHAKDAHIAASRCNGMMWNSAPTTFSPLPFAECACGWTWNYPRDMRRDTSRPKAKVRA